MVFRFGFRVSSCELFSARKPAIRNPQSGTDGVPLPGRAAFTLIELLLVLLILGILAAVSAPTIGTMLAGGKLRTGARELASAERYARSMALLNQTPIDLVVNLEEGRFSVVARERETNSRFGISDLAALTNDVGYTEELLYTSARRHVSLGGGFGLAVSQQDRDSGAETNALAMLQEKLGEEMASEVSFADTINVDRDVDGVTFSFDGYRDQPTTRRGRRYADDSGETEHGEVTIRYRANGTVRPHRWTVHDAEAPSDQMHISVNAVGRSTVYDDGEKEP